MARIRLTIEIPPELSRRIFAAAASAHVTRSTLVREVLAAALPPARGESEQKTLQRVLRRTSRLMIRLLADDRSLLRRRAFARGMSPATYISVLARSHLRGLSPLPDPELRVLKGVISELANLTQYLTSTDQAAVRAGHSIGAEDSALHDAIRLCEAVRRETKALIRANLLSWELTSEPTTSGEGLSVNPSRTKAPNRIAFPGLVPSSGSQSHE
jgi:hypothetical protein